MRQSNEVQNQESTIEGNAIDSTINVDNQSGAFSAPAINVPKGGGTIAGIGEKFQANPVTGTGNTSVPVALSPGRNGFAPRLALSYDSGNGNTAFGMGWDIGIPSISRKTQKGLPQYQDEEESDIFLLAGSEDLIPKLEEINGDWLEVKVKTGDFSIKQYRPRIEGLYAKIERHTDQSTGIAHWEVTTKDNITSVYGKSSSARTHDPENETHIYMWMLEYTYDEKGNIILYEYKQENSDEINAGLLSEKNRLTNNNAFNKIYLKSVKYTPDTPFHPSTTSYFTSVNWHFTLILDYGEHDLLTPTPAETGNWTVRKDPFSSFRAGFEIRTYRLCKRILLFHAFENDLGPDPYLVKSTDITHDENAVATRISSIKHVCYEAGKVQQDHEHEYPPISFSYTEPNIDTEVYQHGIEDLENLPNGVNGSKYKWTDLYGEGLSGVLIEDQNAWYFKKNLGDENYYKDLPANETPAPEARLGAVAEILERPSLAGGQQLTDIDGNGTPDLVVYSDTISGYYEKNKEGGWESFRPFESVPNINWSDPDLRRIDIDGDGFADLLMTQDNCFVCYPSQAEKGFGPSYETLKSFEEEEGPKIVFSDVDQSVYLADMSGDGLTDIVRIKNGSVCYWPNKGYGIFGAKVSLDNAPWFDHEDIFNQQRIRLADVDGSGTTDIIYIANDGVKYYANQSGNSFGEEILINQRLPTHNLANITTIDILGNGTQCLVWSSPVEADHPPTMKYIDLMGGIKPYLLTEVNNNMGSISRMKYAPSTKFYLRDERNGTPWITKLPFPVQVVERVEIWDEVNRNRFVSKYAYHHGYFDGAEREFRGFGMVEQWDTESFTDFEGEGLFPPGYNASEETLHADPIYTKSWFHLGFYQEGEKILGQYQSEYWAGDSEAFVTESQPELPGSSFEERREAARALKGSPLRQEVYAQDGAINEGIPYVVTENTFQLIRVQPRASERRDRDYASFQVIPTDAFSYQYERNAADPRISHQLTLASDEYGQVLQSAAIVYSRRNSIGYAEQDKPLVTISEAEWINEVSNPSFYRIGVPAKTTLFEANDLPAPMDGAYEKEELKQLVDSLRTIPFDQVKEEQEDQYHLSFDGTSSYVAVKDLYYDTANSINELTIEAWVKTSYSGSSYNNNWAIFDLDRSEFFNFYVRGDGKVGFSTMADGSAVHDMAGTQTVNDGEWHHLAAVYDGADKIIYVDGVEDHRITNPHGATALGNNTTRFVIIGDGSEATAFDGSRNNIYYQGELAELRYWETARSAQEIAENYNKQLQGTETALKLYYPMSEGGGITLIDATGNGYDGTLRNMGSGWISGGPYIEKAPSNESAEVYAVDFNGSSSYVAVKDLFYNQANSINALTIESWVNTSFSGTSFNSNWAIFDLDRSEFFNFYVRGDGKVGFSTMADGSAVHDMAGTQTVNDSQWHHVAAVYDGTDKIIYVDGVEDTRVTNAHGGRALGKNSTRYVIIGDGSEATSFDGARNSNYFDGMLAELRFWEVARTPQEIADSLSVRLMGDEPGLTLYYDMAEGEGLLLNDRSANGYDGYMRNMADTWETVDIILQNSGTKRILQQSQIQYYDEGLAAPLPFGQVASHALPYESYQLALTAGLIHNILNDSSVRVDDALLSEGQYIDLLSDGDYWVSSGRAIYDAARFFLPTAQLDPFGNQTTFGYDSYDLLLTSTTDALSNVSSAQYDYRLLQPDLVTDPNGNRQAFAFDVRGMVTKMAIMGKSGDSEGDTLADPTTEFAYDLFEWFTNQKPNYAYSKSREKHGAGNARFIESYAYSNGLGQVMMTKNKVADGEAFSRDGNGDLLRDGSDHLILANASPRWLGNGRTILDNKGNPIKQYEPYFSSTHAYETEAELVEYGVTPVIHYDPLGRAIRTELPDDTLTRVEFTPWEQKNYDQNDTVKNSLWYTSRNSPDPDTVPEPSDKNERSAWLAAKHDSTPQVIHMDVLGRPFVTIDHNKLADGSDEFITMTTQLDIQGNPLRITDAKGRTSFIYTYNLLGQPVKTTHLDNGTRYALNNVVGNPLRAWDDRSQQFRFTYDELLRPTKTYLIDNWSHPEPVEGYDEQLISLTVYGDASTGAASDNLINQPYLIFDAAGLVKNTSFDFKGNPLSSERQMAVTYQTSPDWSALDSFTDVATLLSDASPLLSTEVFVQSTSYDALNRPTSMTKPDSSVVTPGYDDGGQLVSIATNLRGSSTATSFVTAITYNERGQRKYMTYGNGSHTTYHYDEKTFRLTRLITTRHAGADVLQDLNYTYDPVGNIVGQIDDAQQTHFFNNTEVSPDGKYEYDALYRLLKAEGRELIGLNAPGNADININAVPENTTALREYTESYEYDELGNIEKMIHAATGGNWTRHYHYNSGFTNNLLLSNSTDGVKPADQYTYDAHGNMTAMPHLSSMSWDYADRLQSANLGGGGLAYYTYDAGGDRARKVIVNGNITEERIYLGDYEVYRKTVSGTLDTEKETLHISDDTGRIALVDTETTNSNAQNIRYQLTNHLGSASLELDSAAAIISYEEYHPFGATSYLSGRNSAETSLKRYRYVGKERDDETGLYYYGARYYAAWLARFISTDPLKDKYPQLASYQYAGNDPVGDVDIDGLEGTATEDRTGGQGPVLSEREKSGATYAEGAIIEQRDKIWQYRGEEGWDRIYRGEVRPVGGTYSESETIYSTRDLWRDLRPDYNRNGNYSYSQVDLEIRLDFLKTDNPIRRHILANERDGVPVPIARSEAEDYYGGASELHFRTFLKTAASALEVLPGAQVKGVPLKKSKLIKPTTPKTSNAKLLDDFELDQGFTGVFDSATGKISFKPSNIEGSPITLKSGTVIDDVAKRRGGHGSVADAMGGSRDAKRGFAIVKKADDALEIRWTSRTLNRRADDFSVPQQFRKAIIDEVKRTLPGYKIQ